MGTSITKVAIRKIYQKLFSIFGPQKWWPAKTRLEVIIGAILVQNTNWSNAEKAIDNLRKRQLLSVEKLKSISVQKLALVIKPAGYFRVKAKRLKNFIYFLFKEFDGSLNKMAKEKSQLLRQRLLSVNGIGPETADSIILYAFNKPVFVVDAYTKRIFSRHQFVKSTVDYQTLQNLFLESLAVNTTMFNEYHALIVYLGKTFCKPKKPLCSLCPLRDFLHVV
ncbi:MAG: endonuclease III domain-containing protein [Candidatus Omnitrophica bacterium]|nr:endonuclease III domain-containing protein [Candidatus Omnitrophota bacterium]